MKQVFSRLHNIKLRQIITGIIVVLAFLVSTAFDIHGNQLQAQAEPVTPEATRYNVDRTSARYSKDVQSAAKDLTNDTQQAANNAAENTKQAGNNIIDNIREKLNLDEPIDPGTKLAGEQLKDAASKAVKAPQRAIENVTDRD